MRIISGATLLDQTTHPDERGRLTAFEQDHNLPFSPERVFVLSVDDPRACRGGHANSCDEVIVALRGGVTASVDNGIETARIRLTGDAKALWVRAGLVIHLFDFTPETLLLVCASERYENTRHFARPQPHATPERATA